MSPQISLAQWCDASQPTIPDIIVTVLPSGDRRIQLGVCLSEHVKTGGCAYTIGAWGLIVIKQNIVDCLVFSMSKHCIILEKC